MVEQRIVEALVAHGNYTNSGIGGEGSQGNEISALRACTDKDFMNIKPWTFFGNEGVVGPTSWIEKRKSILEINSCAEESKVKFCHLHICRCNYILVEWPVNTPGLANANALSWEQLK